MSKEKSNKVYISEYKDAKNHIIHFIEQEEKKILNLQSPYGSGKSYLIKDIQETLSKNKKNKIIIYDKVFSSIEQIDFAFKIKDEKSFFKRINIEKKANQKITFFWNLTLPTLVFAISFLFENIFSNKNLFFILLYFPIYFLWLYFKKSKIWFSIFKKLKNIKICICKRKTTIIIFENIDRIEMNLIEYIFSYSYAFFPLEWNKNFKIIFSYDSEKIKERYKEKYGFFPQEISGFLEKYTDQIINMLDYNEEAPRKIKEKMIKENKNDKENFKFSKFIIENYFFNNLRLFNRTLYFLSKNNKLIKMLDLNINICFVMYYLSIYDLKIFNFIRNDIFPDIPFDPRSFFKDEKEKDEKIKLKKYDDKKIDEFIVNFFNEYIFINSLENHNDFYDKNETTYLQYLQKRINNHIIKNVIKEQFNEMKKYHEKNINEKFKDLIKDEKIEIENKKRLLFRLWNELNDENKYITLFQIFNIRYLRNMDLFWFSKIKEIEFSKIKNPFILNDFLWILKYIFFIYLDIMDNSNKIEEIKTQKQYFEIINTILQKLDKDKKQSPAIDLLKHIFVTNKFMKHYFKIIKANKDDKNLFNKWLDKEFNKEANWNYQYLFFNRDIIKFHKMKKIFARSFISEKEVDEKIFYDFFSHYKDQKLLPISALNDILKINNKKIIENNERWKKEKNAFFEYIHENEKINN